MVLIERLFNNFLLSADQQTSMTETVDRILVTGATGTVGSRVCEQLQDHDVTVVAAVRDPDSRSLDLDVV